MTLRDLQHRYSKAVGRRDALRSDLSRVKEEIASLENDEALLELVGDLFRTLIDKEITEAVQSVESLLTEGLQTVFADQDLSVRADVEIKRGKVSVDLVTVQKDANGALIEGSPLDSFGGSVQTVQSVLMRVIIIHLRELAPVLFLDESLPAFDPGYVVNMAQFLSMLCDRLGMDILIITHNASLFDAADKAYRVKKVGGEARFVLERDKGGRP